MKTTTLPLILFALFALPALANHGDKPSYSFGDGPRKCNADSDCAIIIVSCQKCDWADSVNKASLAASEKTVREYCEKWKKRPTRPKDCKEIPKVQERIAVCRENLCEAQTYFDHAAPPVKAR